MSGWDSAIQTLRGMAESDVARALRPGSEPASHAICDGCAALYVHEVTP